MYPIVFFYATFYHLYAVQDVLKSRHRFNREAYFNHTKSHREYIDRQYGAICTQTWLCPHSTCLFADGWILSCWVVAFYIFIYQHLGLSGRSAKDLWVIWFVAGQYWVASRTVMMFLASLRQQRWESSSKSKTRTPWKSTTTSGHGERVIDGGAGLATLLSSKAQETSIHVHRRRWTYVARIKCVAIALATGWYKPANLGWFGSRRAENTEFHQGWAIGYFALLNLLGFVAYGALRLPRVSCGRKKMNVHCSKQNAHDLVVILDSYLVLQGSYMDPQYDNRM